MGMLSIFSDPRSFAPGRIRHFAGPQLQTMGSNGIVCDAFGGSARNCWPCKLVHLVDGFCSGVYINLYNRLSRTQFAVRVASMPRTHPSFGASGTRKHISSLGWSFLQSRNPHHSYGFGGPAIVFSKRNGVGMLGTAQLGSSTEA